MKPGTRILYQTTIRRGGQTQLGVLKAGTVKHDGGETIKLTNDHYIRRDQLRNADGARMQPEAAPV